MRHRLDKGKAKVASHRRTWEVMAVIKLSRRHLRKEPEMSPGKMLWVVHWAGEQEEAVLLAYRKPGEVG